MGTNSIAHGRLNLTENLSLFTLNYCELEICYVSTLNQATFLDKEKKNPHYFLDMEVRPKLVSERKRCKKHTTHDVDGLTHLLFQP